MRRWRGPFRNWTVELRAISYEDSLRISRILANTLDPIMESLARSIFNDLIITNNANYVWITGNDEIRGLNRRLQGQNTVSADFLRENNLNIVSVFTFVTVGPVGRSRDPVR